MTHIGGSLYIGHESDVGLPPRPTYGGVSPFMQQIIGETPEGAGLGLGVEPSWMGLGGAFAPDPRMIQQRQAEGLEGGIPTRPTFTGVSDIYDALAAKQISRAQAQAYLERLMTPAQARNLLDENFPVGTEEPEPVSAAATPTWNTPSEVYASVRDNPQLYWDGVEALVGLGLNRGGSMDYLGPLIEGYTGGGDVESQRRAVLAAQGLDGGIPDPFATGSITDRPDYRPQTAQYGIGEGSPFARSQQLEEQRLGDPAGVFSRIMQTIPGFSEFNPYAQAAIESRFGDIYARHGLSQFSSPDTGFEDYIRAPGSFGRGDPGVLKGQLGSLRDLLDFGTASIPVETQSALLGRFQNPDYPEASSRNLLQALLQPGLASVAPSFRGGYASTMKRAFDRFQASQPDAGVLSEFSRRGYF